MCLCGLCAHECRDLLRPEVSDSLHLGSWSYRWMGTADRFWELSLAPLHEQCDYSEPLSHHYYLFYKRLNLFLIVYTPTTCYDIDTQACTHMHTCAHMQYTYTRHTWTHTHQHAHKYAHTWTCTHMCAHIHTRSHTFTCMNMHTHAHTFTCMNMHTHSYTGTHTRTRTRTHSLITLMPNRLLFPFHSCQRLFLFTTVFSLTSNLFVLLGDQDCQCDHEFRIIQSSLGEAGLNVLFGVSTEALLSSQQPCSSKPLHTPLLLIAERSLSDYCWG